MDDKRITKPDVTADGETQKAYDGEYFGRERPIKRKIFYICNQKRCGKTCSAKNGECFRTSDVKYAAHYMSEPTNKRLEKSFNKTYMILDEPYYIYEEKKDGE